MTARRQSSASIRAWATDGLGFLGVEIDAERNETATGDHTISAPQAPASTLVITAREDIEIAHQVRALLSR